MTRVASVGLTLAGLLCASTAFGQAGKELVGKYTMDADAEETLELRADGTANMGGDETRWSVKGSTITIDTDTVPFKLAGGKLTLTMGPGIQLSWTKVGAAGKGPSALQKAAAKASKKQNELSDEEAEAEAMKAAQEWLARNGHQAGLQQGQPAAGPQGAHGQPGMPGQGGPQGQPMAAAGPVGNGPQDRQIAQLLLSTGWCSFSYSQTSGTSRTSKGYFRQDGTLVLNTGAETYNSGYAGTVAGQYAGGSTMRWRVQNARLLVDDGSGAGFVDVNASLDQNSSGSWILKADGKEYSMCR